MLAGKEYYQKTVSEIFTALESSKLGLSTHDAGRRLLNYSTNELPEERKPAILLVFLEQFKNPLIYILVIASLMTLYLRDYVDTVVIALAVFVNTILGFIQEYKAQNAIYALKNIFTPKAYVLRSGKTLEIENKYLVPGDIVSLKSGTKVPADIRLIEANDLRVNEASLTGESASVQKKLGVYKEEKITPDIKNTVFWGTEITSGNAAGVVVKTGLETELGKIAKDIRDAKEEKTPLQEKLATLGKNIAIVVLSASVLVFIIGVLSKKEITEMFSTSVALAVAAIPEGLVVSLTVILAIGMQKIFKRKALVRKLVAAETLGSVTVICTDKTGTLTEGNMKVVGWKLNDLSQTLKAAALCNDISNQTEIALWEKLRTVDHFDPQRIKEKYLRLASIPFSSERKYMAVLNNENHDYLIYAKGAPEVILNWCKLGIREKEKWEEITRKWADKGLRVLALCYKYVKGPKSLKPNPQLYKDFLHRNIEDRFVFLGLVAFADPVRPEVKEALIECKRAGIRTVVITGDFSSTARAVLEELNIKVDSSEIMEGSELEKMEEDELKSKIANIKLFSRVTPAHKLRIVNILKKIGEVIAMTGDGINDAPALKSSDIGIVVGSATEVARETSDMVLLDSNFKTIVSAIEEGRVIFDNIRKVALYLLSDSFSEIILILASIIFKLPLPLTAAQILWINLVTDGLPGLALAYDPKRYGIMNERPRNAGEPILNTKIKIIIAVTSVITGFISLLVFYFFLKISGNIEFARTVTFAVLGVASLLYVFSCRNLDKSVFKDKNLFSNKFLLGAIFIGFIMQVAAIYIPVLSRIFKTVPLNLYHWIIVLIFSFSVIMSIEAVKYGYSYLKAKNG